MKDLIIVGSGSHAKVVIDTVEAQGEYRITGLLDDISPTREPLFGHEILGSTEVFPQYAANHEILVAIGHNWDRKQVVDRILALVPEARFATVISPAAILSRTAKIGVGVVITAGAFIGTDSEVAEHAIVNTYSVVDHESSIGPFASLSAGCLVGGNCRLDACSIVAIGATLASKLTLGEHALLGAGATALKSVSARCIAYGTPAREIRTRNPEDRYM